MVAEDKDSTLIVKDVYGRVHLVSMADYATGRRQLRLYTPNGTRLSEHYARMRWKGRSTTIHRSNVAEVVGGTSASNARA